MVKSRAQWLDEGERPTKFFCALENKNFLDKTIKKIHDDDDKIVTDQKAILTTIGKYYTKLFENRDTELNKAALNDFFKTQTANGLSDNKRNSIEGPLTLSERTQKNEKR